MAKVILKSLLEKKKKKKEYKKKITTFLFDDFKDFSVKIIIIMLRC